jgi:hypothetical protein
MLTHAPSETLILRPERVNSPLARPPGTAGQAPQCRAPRLAAASSLRSQLKPSIHPSSVNAIATGSHRHGRRALRP